MSFVETRCRLCTEEFRTKSVAFHDTDVDHLKYKYKLKILFEDLALEEDDTSPFLLCLFCVEKLRSTFDFRRQCLDALQFWDIHFGRAQTKSIDKNFKIIPSVHNQYTKYELFPAGKEQEVSENNMDEVPIKQEIPDPVPLVGNMKNKLNSLLKLGPLETKTSTTALKTENPDTAPILSLTLLGRKNMFKNKIEPTTTTNAKTMKLEDVPNSVIKPILNISKLKQNLNRRINIAAGVDVKSEPDDDDDMPLKTLKRKLNENAKNATVASPAPVKLNIFSLKNKLGTALKVGELLQEKQKKERKPKKHGFIVDINNIIADKKNNIYYCKYCYKYFQNVVALRYHVVLHGKPKKPRNLKKAVEETVKKVEKPKPTAQRTTEEPPPEKNGKKQTQCDICEKWFINVLMHKARAHKNTK